MSHRAPHLTHEVHQRREPRFKPMDVIYQDVIAAPRCLVLDVYARGNDIRYETVSERGGCGSIDDRVAMATTEEWLEWLTKFQDEMLPPVYRAAQERVRTPLVEPDFWAGYRTRYAATGCPWIQ